MNSVFLPSRTYVLKKNSCYNLDLIFVNLAISSLSYENSVHTEVIAEIWKQQGPVGKRSQAVRRSDKL